MEFKSKLSDNLIYKNCNWPYIILLTFVLALICGFRLFSIDRDYYDYLNFFNSILGYDPERMFRYKFGFKYLTIFLTSLSESYTFYLFSISFLSLLPKIFLISKHSRDLIFSIFIYILLIFPSQDMTQIRAGLAYSFFYFGIYLLNKSKSLYGYFFLILSTTIHISTIALSFLYFLTNFFVKKEQNIIKSLFAIVFLFISLYAFSTIVSSYIPEGLGSQYLQKGETSQEVSNIFSLRVLNLLAIGSIGLRLKKMMPTQANNWLSISIFGLLIYYTMPQFKTLSLRVNEFSFFSYLLWIDYLPKNTRYISKIILLITALSNFYLLMKGGYFYQNQI